MREISILQSCKFKKSVPRPQICWHQVSQAFSVSELSHWSSYACVSRRVVTDREHSVSLDREPDKDKNGGGVWWWVAGLVRTEGLRKQRTLLTSLGKDVQEEIRQSARDQRRGVAPCAIKRCDVVRRAA